MNKRTKFWKIYFCLILLFISAVSDILLAGESKTSPMMDSLLVVLNKAGEDSNKVYLFIDLAYACFDEGDEKGALNYALESIALAQQINFKKGESSAFHLMGNIYSDMGNYTIALGYFQKSLKIKRELNDLKGIANANNNLGSVYVSQGNYPAALACFYAGLKIREQMQDKIGIAESCNNIGNVYVYLKDHSKALDFLRTSLKIKMEIGDKKKIAGSLNNIATVLCYQDSFTQSMIYYQQALKINQEIGNQKGISMAYSNIANLYCDIFEFKNSDPKKSGDKLLEFNYVPFKNELDSAIVLHLKAMKIQQEIGDNATRIYSLMGIGKSFHLKRNYAQAVDFYKKAYALADSMEIIERQEAIAKYLVDSYTQLSDFKNALEWQNKYIEHKDSLFNEERTQEMTRTEMNFEFEKKEAIAKINQKRKEEAMQHESNVQKLLIALISIGFILVLVFAVFVFRSLKVRNLQNKVISEQKLIVETKQKEIIDSITYAKNIQQAMLPGEEKWRRLLPDSFVLYLPKDIVAGDFYWAEKVDHYIFVAAADCTGHGVPGAMVSVVCNNALNRAISEFNKKQPGEILDKTRELVVESFSKSEGEVKDGMDISLLCLDTLNHKICWSGANNPLWIFRASENNLDEIKADKLPVGKGYGQIPFTTHEVLMNKSDTLYLFTDGYADQFGGEHAKKMTKKRFRELLVKIGNKTLAEQQQALLKFHHDFKATQEQVDDICVIGIRLV